MSFIRRLLSLDVLVAIMAITVAGLILYPAMMKPSPKPIPFKEVVFCKGGYAFMRKNDGETYPVTGRNGVATPCNE